MTQEDRMEWKQMFAEILQEADFATKDDLKNLVTRDDLKNLATKDDIIRIEARMEQMEVRIEQLEARMEQMEARMEQIEKYVHEKFLLIENEMVPKINAMYEALTTRVSHEECNERMGLIEGRADAITPLLLTVKKNTSLLEEHEGRIRKLESPA